MITGPDIIRKHKPSRKPIIEHKPRGSVRLPETRISKARKRRRKPKVGKRELVRVRDPLDRYYLGHKLRPPELRGRL